MKVGMRIVWTACLAALAVLVVVFVVWLVRMPGDGDGDSAAGSTTGPARGDPVLRIGLIPERDIFEQRKRYQALADYLAGQLGGPVDLVTRRTYGGILQDFEDDRIDAAFLGSLVTVLAMDRLGVKVVAKPVMPDGVSTYHGVIFVRQDSPIRKLEDLSGHSIAMVRTTTAGQMFGVCVMARLGLLKQPKPPRAVWIGTHDDVALKVMDGELDAGAIKNLRLDALERSHPQWQIRRLARGRRVPNNALCLRADVAERLGPRLLKVLVDMTGSAQGRDTLAALGASHFVPCHAEDYVAVYDMAECVGAAWEQLGGSDPLPRRPPDWPKPDPTKARKCYDVDY